MVNKCSLCKDSEESIDHILIHCDKIRELWTLLLAVFDLVLGVCGFNEKSSPRMGT